MQGAWPAVAGTAHGVRRGSDNAVAAQARLGMAKVKRSGRSQDRATPQTAIRSNFCDGFSALCQPVMQ